MARKHTKVVSLARARALRETEQSRQARETQVAIYLGARNEFRVCVAPIVESLLDAKGADKNLRKKILMLLEAAYTACHIDTPEINAAVESLTTSMTNRS